MELFSDRSVVTMMHGIVLGGAALLSSFGALFAMYVMRPAGRPGVAAASLPRSVGWLIAGLAALLWLTTLTGTYVVFPPYRATPPPGVTDLAAYPRAMLLAHPGTAWLHAFAMESKEHMPWIASMLATAVAFVATRRRLTLQADARLYQTAMLLLAVCFALVAFTALLGTRVNKVAPLE